jgi:hypothetical protein
MVVRNTTFVTGERNYISGFEGSQAVPACPSGTGNAYDRKLIFMTLEELHYSKV